MTPCAARFEPLNAYVDGELEPAEELDLRRHLDVCEVCRTQVDGLLALKEAVAGSIEVRPVPHTLRERLGTLGQPHPRRWTGGLVALAALAAAVFVAIGVTRLIGRARQAEPDRVVEALVADHLHFLQVEDAVELASDDPAEIAGWFADKVPFPVHVPPLRGGTLLGGRLCSLWGKKVALTFYEVEGGRVSLFVVDPATVPARPQPAVGCTATLGDYRVCFVPTSATLLAMVADKHQTAAILPELEALANPRL
jgi:anti-sigma factor RsiW